MDKNEKIIDELLSKMTLAEKIGQLNQVPSPLVDDEKLFEDIRKGKIGSLIMAQTPQAGNDGAEIAYEELLNKLQRIAAEESRMGIPLIYGRDVIHGHRTVMPIPIGSAASFDEELVKKCYTDVAREAARQGIHWTFAPMLDMARDPRWGRCVEGPGEDPYLGSVMAKAMVEGFQGKALTDEGSIAACAKHYIGYGASEGGRDYNRTEISDYSLRNYYLRAFKAAVDSGVQTVMSSFNQISGQPVSSSRYLLTDLLKDELGFDGYIVSDWGAVYQLQNHGVAKDQKQAAELSLNAGLDMDMCDECYIKYLEQLVAERKVSTERLDDSVRRVLRVKLRLGLFERPYIPQYEIDFEVHKQDARRLAAESMVLLKNENSVLPLKENSAFTLAGEMAEDRQTMLGAWCCDGSPDDVVTVYDGIRANAPDCKVFFNPSINDVQRIKESKDDTVVLCIGEWSLFTGEANSIAMIETVDTHLELARLAHDMGKTVIVVLFYGRPRAIEKLEPYCDAILWAWHPGTEAGNAVADILFGKVNPGGKLSMTLPRCTGQIPIYYNLEPAARNVNGYYGNCEYKNYHDCDGTPMYPFGYGLSYSHFEISGVTVDRKELTLSEIKNGERFKFSVDIKNISDIAGSEVVQLYVRDNVASMTRPLRELKAYKKVMLKPQESKNILLEIGFDELGFYGSDGRFVVEPGEFDIFIGNDSYAEKTVTVKVN